MKKIKLETLYIRRLADTVTPVSIYLRLRDKFAGSILLESSDYHGNDNTFSYICCDPIASFAFDGQEVKQHWPDGKTSSVSLEEKSEVLQLLKNFRDAFDAPKSKKYIETGLFG